MSAAATILSAATWVALAVLAAAFLLTVWRVVQGPTLPDRVVALDMLVGIVIGFIALIAIRTGFTLYIDIAISLGLVGFLATVAFARFILAGRPLAAGGGTATGVPAPQAGSAPGKPAGKAAKRSQRQAARQTEKAAARKPGKGEAAKTKKAPGATSADVPQAGPAGEVQRPSAKSSARKSARKPERGQ